MAPRKIRIIGDPVLKTPTEVVKEIDGSVKKIVDEMFETLVHEERGIGLAANQIGVSKKIFVYDFEEDGAIRKGVVINPVIAESRGEWVYREGCLSVPGLFWDIVRPKEVLLKGIDLEGNEIEIEGDTLFGRLIQHELDHLEGHLLIERLTNEQREAAKSKILNLISSNP